ncbi:MAG: urease accessory protein UreF [Burkholderiaceae bacterium]
MNTLGQLALMRLASPALPIGGFSYSQGLESAIEARWVTDTESLAQWLLDALSLNVGQYEAPMVFSMARAVRAENPGLAEQLNDDYLASRETAELHAETCQMGYSLLRLLAGLSETSQVNAVRRAMPAQASNWIDQERPASLPFAWAMASNYFNLLPAQSLSAYAWAWLENQVAAAIKAVPLGQQAGQIVFDRVQPALANALEEASAMSPSDLSNFAPGAALASTWHETQYSRLFRS